VDSWLLLSIMMEQSAAERARWAHTRAAREMAAGESKGRLRAWLASLLARAAICLDREAGRTTLAGAPNH
jgi:hypothetical protein